MKRFFFIGWLSLFFSSQVWAATYYRWSAYDVTKDASLDAIYAQVSDDACHVTFWYNLRNLVWDKQTRVDSLRLYFSGGLYHFGWTNTYLRPGDWGRYYAYHVPSCRLGGAIVNGARLNFARITTSSF